jgi:hypothetical protein
MPARTALLLLCLLPAFRGSAADARLEIFAPSAHETVSGVLPIVEVLGRAWTGEPAPLDLVIALDVSESAFLPAGGDVDGDGTVGCMRVRRIRRLDGSSRPPQTWTTDPGDTVFEAQREIARRVLDRVGPQGARVAVLGFAEEVRIRARLGSVERARAELAGMRRPSVLRATDFARAIRVGTHLLQSSGSRGRPRVMLLLSDGLATRPTAIAHAAALSAARAAARSGIAIHTVSVGRGSAGPSSVYAGLAARSFGRFALWDRLDGLLGAPPFIGPPLALDRIEITNTTTGEPGRALRVEERGRFDGFVRLVRGANVLRVRAVAADGTRLDETRTVFFAPPAAITDADRALAEAVRLRSRQIELAHGIPAVIRARRSWLEIHAEAAPGN